MKPRRGFALLAALWFVLAITTVALQFALVAHERRTLGLISADRGRQRAAAAGALAMLQAQMDYDLRNNGTASGRANVAGLQSSDPWLGADSIYSGTYYVDTIPVQVVARDLGTMINVNTANQQQLNLLFNFVLGDAITANQMAVAILDWRDQDDLARPQGAERDDYIKANMLALPTNAPFREVEDLINVYGVTWDEVNAVYPYLTTHGPSGNGASRVNINSAPEPVLRALPGMTDAILVQILALRSQGRRIQSVAQVMAGTPQGRQATQVTVGRGGATTVTVSPVQSALTTATTVNTENVELTFYVRSSANDQPTRLIALISRTNNQATISWQLW
jgi:general secretion pathway protein K